MYLALSIIFLIAALAIAAFLTFTMARAVIVDKELITQKNLIYLVPAFTLVYLLYLTAAIYNGESIDFFYCVNLASYALSAFTFELQLSLIGPLTAAYPLFCVDFVLAVIISAATFILGVCSFFSQRIRNFFSLRARLAKRCDIVVGDSPSALLYAKNNRNSVVWATDISRSRYADLLKDGYTVVRAPFEAKAFRSKFGRREYNIIVFRDGNGSYTNVIGTFAELKKLGCAARLNLEANQEEIKIIKEKFVSGADKEVAAHIACFSKYELIARRFVAEYPITKFIPRSFFNENFTLKSDKEINVVFIGFGKVNYQLFRMCAMQFQFARGVGDRLASKPVHYYVYDNKSSALHNEFFSRILYEFDEEFADCDFPKPERICDLTVVEKDNNSVEAKSRFKKLVNQNSFTYFVISLDNDLEDASYAQTVKRLLADERQGNYRIFVRAKNGSGERLNSRDDSVIYFGDEKSLFTHDSVVNDDLLELAQRINLLYNKISDPPEWLRALRALPVAQQSAALSKDLENAVNKRLMHEKWAELPLIEQSSNLYHALNLPFKLNLLGFDMVKGAEGQRGVSEEEFNKHYVNSGRESGYADYSFFFGTESSNVLAYIEHSRWNALYILYDYRQMKKAEMSVVEGKDASGTPTKSLPHKDTAHKRHACITTYYGLNDLIMFKYGALESEADLSALDYKTDERLRELAKIYAYDYMDLDKLYAEITAMGYILLPSAAKDV